MAGGIQRPAQRRDIAGDAGRRLVMADQHRLDAMGLVGGEALGIGLDRRPLAPFALDHVHLEAEAPAHLDPEMGELAEAGGEHPVAGRERVGEGRLPAAGAGAREEEHLARRRS